MMIKELIEMAEALVVALTILGEAGGEDFDGQVMVLEVIVNRSNQRGQTLKEVCLAPKQFSCWNGSAAKKLIAKTADWNTINSHSWADCIRLARMACMGGYRTTTTATHYFNPKLCNPSWAKSMKRVATVGNHEFYEE